MTPGKIDRHGEEGESLSRPEGEKIQQNLVMDEGFFIRPVGKEAENIRRVNCLLLNDGKESSITLSAPERIARDGWDDQAVKYIRVGERLVHLHNGEYEVTAIERGRIHVRNIKEGDSGYIPTTSKDIKAHEYRFRIQDNLGKTKEIKVYDTIFKDRALRTKEFLNDLVSAIPAQHLNAIDEIRLDRFTDINHGKFGMESSLLGSNGVLTLYLVPENFEDDEEISAETSLYAFYHEFGHAIANKIRGTAHPGPRWTRAKKSDGNEMSEYSAKKRSKSVKNDEGEVEDFAEAVALYLATDGAKTERYAKYRVACRARFEYLDDLFGNPVHQEVMNTNRLLRMVLGRQVP